jgi:tRNA 2-thiouridine synthesizing protein A
MRVSLARPGTLLKTRFGQQDDGEGPMSETLLDVKEMSCPLPVLRANRALRSLKPGERLRVLATDRAAVADFQAFCRETGHALLAWSEEGGVFSFVIRRRRDDPEQDD